MNPWAENVSEKEITLDDMIEWVKADPGMLKRIIRAERFIGAKPP